MDPLQGKANYSRVCQLLIDKGGDALRRVLQTKIDISPPPSTLDSLLNAHKKSLQKIRYSVINATQWKLLFPPSGSPDSKNFDITLLTILLRNICGLPSPASGWNVMPPACDTSVSAEILRIKMIRNEVYGHISKAQLDNTEFETLWQQISQPLINLGIRQQDINKLKQTVLSPEEESYIEKLREWKELEDTLSSKLDDIEREVAKLREEIAMSRKIEKNAKTSEINKLAKFFFKRKIEELSKRFHSDTRKWFLDVFKKWFNDNESRVMILTAGPGVGKSVLSARICELYEESGQLAACHFCDFRTSDYRDPHKILQSLASQMCDNVDGFRDKLSETFSREHSRDSLSDTFRVLLNDPLQALDRTEPMLIVVDALDESKTPIKSEFLDLISDQFSQLPKLIKIFISSRPELQVREKLEHLNPVEIRADDDKHNLDLQQFIKCYFPSVSETVIESLVSKCEGSFLYAYYLVKEIKQVDAGNKANVNVDIPKGISGFYEKQFERLKKDLHFYEQETGVSIFKNFLNVVAASDKPLPFRFLFACMDLFGERFQLRKTIVGIMSEILPVYDDCLTVFHKSLWDWLTLNGYEEHAYAADVSDGEKRLWRACKKVYTDIDSLSSVLNFQISPEKRYALENGAKHCMNVDGAEDWEWLVNVKVNYFKFFYGLDDVEQYTTTRLVKILEEYKSRISYDLSLKLFQLYAFLKMIRAIILTDIRVYHRMYLQCFANKQFCLVHNAATSRKDASEMLRQTNTIWLEEVTNEADSSFKIISSTPLFKDNAKIEAISTSPLNNLLAIITATKLNVYELPGLGNILKLNLNEIIRRECPNIAFSPDSLYLILNSLQKCVSIKHKGVLPFIPHGPAKIRCCSFSSCGTKLASMEEKSIKVWDLGKRELSAESRHQFDRSKWIICFSSCNSYIFFFNSSDGQLKVCDSTTLNVLETARTDTCSTKLDDCIQFISPRFSTGSNKALRFNMECWQLTTGQNILCASKHCSMPFVWRDRKCVMTSSSILALVVYDYVNQQVIDTFQLSSLPSYRSIIYIANLGTNTFLICSQNTFLLVLSLESSSEFSAFSFINDDTYPLFCSLSPDNLYVACSYGSPILKIMTVDDGKILQTVAPKQKPVACWWSELYLWVVCEGSAVVKYPYISTHSNVVGNYVQECSIDCDDDALKFKAGVLVCLQINRKISISKICDKNLSRQQILDSKLDSSCEVAISSDGCAVLLYNTYWSCLYELWEMGSENNWELHSTGKLNPSTWGGCLAGKQNFRRLLWLSAPDDSGEESALCSIDFSDATPKTVVHQLPIELFFPDVVYVDCKVLIFCDAGYIHLIHVPDGTVITSLYVGYIEKSFFVPSKRLLFLFTGDGNIKHFKIRNIDKFFPPK